MCTTKYRTGLTDNLVKMAVGDRKIIPSCNLSLCQSYRSIAQRLKKTVGYTYATSLRSNNLTIIRTQ